MQRVLGVVVFLWLFRAYSATAFGGLLVAPAGTLLFNGTGPEDQLIDVSGQVAGSQLLFYGARQESLFVSENGNVVFAPYGTNESDVITLPLGDFPQRRIAPLWDDFLLHPELNNQVLLDYRPNQYLAVTWSNMRLYLETVALQLFPDTTRSAQVVWFEGDTELRGFQFLAGDIAFGYSPHKLTGPDYFGDVVATVGLSNGNTFSALPGTNKGAIVAPDGHLLPWDPNSVLLFRPSDSGASLGLELEGGYHRGTIALSAVPEPGSLLLAMIPILLIGTFLRKHSMQKLVGVA